MIIRAWPTESSIKYSNLLPRLLHSVKSTSRFSSEIACVFKRIILNVLDNEDCETFFPDHSHKSFMLYFDVDHLKYSKEQIHMHKLVSRY